MRGLLLLLLAGSAPESAAVLEMEALAIWCADEGLFARLQELYAALLIFDPDHARARRRLGYTKKKNGPWVRKPRRTPPRDRNSHALAEFHARRRAIAARYAARVLGPVESGAATPDEARTITRRVLAIDPDHAAARALRGEVRHKKGWELEETRMARARILALRARATAARTGAERGRPGRLTAEEGALGVSFAGVLRTKSLRLASRAPLTEAPEMLAAAGAAHACFGAVAGVPAPALERLTLLVFADSAKFATAVRLHPKLPDALRRAAAKRSFVWVPSTETVLLHAETTDRRIELCARVLTDRLGLEAFGLDRKIGWAWEGIGLYVGFRATGRRTEVVARRPRYTGRRALPPAESKLWSRMMSAGRNWFALAAEEARTGRPLDFALLLHKDARTMRAKDLLFGYVLVAYLAESKQDQIARILRRIGGGAESAAVLERELGTSLRALELRLVDWAEQRARLGEG